MLALNVSIPCQGRGLPSCEVATWNLLRKSCNQRACHRVVPATWEMGGRRDSAALSSSDCMWRASYSGVFWVVAFYFTSVPVQP